MFFISFNPAEYLIKNDGNIEIHFFNNSLSKYSNTTKIDCFIMKNNIENIKNCEMVIKNSYVISTIIIKNICDKYCDKELMIIKIKKLRNPLFKLEIQPNDEISYFGIKLMTLDNYLISFGKTLTVKNFDFSIDSLPNPPLINLNNDLTGKISKYFFQFNHSIEILTKGEISLQFPNEVKIQDSSTCLAKIFVKEESKEYNLICKITSNKEKINITHEISPKYFVNNLISVEISDVKNPFSVKSTSDFILSSSFEKFKIQEGKFSIKIKQASDFNEIKIMRNDSEINNQIYLNITVNISNKLETTNKIIFNLPKDQINYKNISLIEVKKIYPLRKNMIIDSSENSTHLIVILLKKKKKKYIKLINFFIYFR